MTETTTPVPDEYRVSVWPSRKHPWSRRWGWRFQVDYIGAWDEYGDQALLYARKNWRATKAQATEDGIAQARGIHRDGLDGIWPTDPSADCTPGPLVIHVGPSTPVDERVTIVVGGA